MEMRKDYEKKLAEYKDICVFDVNQLLAIEAGLQSGIDVSIYANPKYSIFQMGEIASALELGMDVSAYSPQMTYQEMKENRLAFIGMTDGEYLVGRIGVDSGQVMIGDPCYLNQWENAPEKPKDFDKGVEESEGVYSYYGACNATRKARPFGLLSLTPEAKKNYGGLGGIISEVGYAVACSTTFGDGDYPVYAKIKDGRVIELRIDFDLSE